eukprot:5699127-Alexandrium_andersonii.AAC.1
MGHLPRNFPKAKTGKTDSIGELETLPQKRGPGSGDTSADALVEKAGPTAFDAEAFAQNAEQLIAGNVAFDCSRRKGTARAGASGHSR